MSEKKILVINGANMDLLGKRDKSALGTDTLESIMDELIEYGREINVEVEAYQSNLEGELINLLHRDRWLTLRGVKVGIQVQIEVKMQVQIGQVQEKRKIV